MWESGLKFPTHVLERVKAVVVEHIDRIALAEQQRQLMAAVPHNQLPAVLQISRDKMIVRRLPGIASDLDTLQLAFAIPGKRRQHVRARSPIQHAGPRLSEDE